MVAMFSKEEDNGAELQPATQGNGAETIIGPTVKIEGAFESTDNILVEGEVIGTLKTTKDLTVAEGAKIEADIMAGNMHISGHIIGNIHVSGKVQLTSTAKIIGDIETDIISIETGATLQGRCVSGQKIEPSTTMEESKEVKKAEEAKK